mmetsp:Transcript_35347/g.104548  ORF Transcript_35347/g.104548 Transcript_35347/m.104548 type:complete len:202 (-) Transcript_35347:315-920(-)
MIRKVQPRATSMDSGTCATPSTMTTSPMFLTSPACVSAPLSSPRKPIALDTSMLNSGDAMHAVIAIDGSPLSASAELPARSPRLLPHAMSVRPSTEPGMRSSDAPSCRMPTTSDATVSTHMQPTMKPASEKSAGAQSQLPPNVMVGTSWSSLPAVASEVRPMPTAPAAAAVPSAVGLPSALKYATTARGAHADVVNSQRRL